MIRLTRPSIDEEDVVAVTDVLRTGMLVQGPRVAAFEKMLADVVGVSHCAAVTNCTAALQLALKALNIKAGDTVAVTTYSWVATANVIELCGAKPLFIDIEADTFNMDAAALERALARSKVSAILPVHAFGQMADMKAIMKIAGDIPVIEDAACALAAERDGMKAGSVGSVACFSFHPRKAITTGEGGAVTTQDANVDRVVRALRNHGAESGAAPGEFVMAGFNMRMTEFQAALGLVQMAKLDRIVNARRAGAAIYDELLKGSDVTPPFVPSGSKPVYQSYVTLLPKGVDRAALMKEMALRGVEVQIGTVHMPLTKFFASRYGFKRGDFPVTDDIAARTLALPLYEGISREDQERVIDTLHAVL